MDCDAHFRTWPNSSSHKSCVKIWFGLVEPFKSYRVDKKKKNKKKINKINKAKSQTRLKTKSFSEKFVSGRITKSDAAENNTFRKIIFRAVKMKKIHRCSSIYYPSEQFFSGWIKIGCTIPKQGVEFQN